MSVRHTIKAIDASIAGRLVANGSRLPTHLFDSYCMLKHMTEPTLWYRPNEPADKTVSAVLLSGKGWEQRHAALNHIRRKDYYISTGGLMYTMTGDDNTYRIRIYPDGVDVVCFGLETVDSLLEGHYDGIDALPDWVKERLAVLNMMPVEPPTNEVEGIGRRISAHVYWVFAPCTRAEASTSA